MQKSSSDWKDRFMSGPAGKLVPWMVVTLGLLLLLVGLSTKERVEKHTLLDFHYAALTQADNAGAADDGAPPPSTDKGTEAPKAEEKPGDQGQVSPTAPGDNIAEEEAHWFGRGISFLGIFAFIGLAFLLSENRKSINWKLVLIGIGLQIGFALFIFFVPFGEAIFSVANDVVIKLLDFTNDGSKFIFASFVTGNQEISLVNFAFMVLPTIIFFSSLMTVLYHLGLMQWIVKGMAWVMLRLMGTSGAESLSAAANIFVGQTEAPLVIKPFVEKMTRSELMTVMTGGFATVAGGVLALYVGMLRPVFPDIAGHLIAASVMSAPAALIIGKIMVPEVETPETMGKLSMDLDKPDANVIEAAARGAGEGLTLALNVGAMLLAFIALVAMLNYVVGMPSMYKNTSALENLTTQAVNAKVAIPEGCAVPEGGDIAAEKATDCAHKVHMALLMHQAKAEGVAIPAKSCPAQMEVCIEALEAGLGGKATISGIWYVPTFQDILGVLFWPFAFIMGVPIGECYYVGQLLGTKVILNELVAYSELLGMLKDPAIHLSKRSVVIATYALFGFANLSSIAIQIGGIGGIAPSRRQDLADLGLKAMFAGVIAACMTATIAGILV